MKEKQIGLQQFFHFFLGHVILIQTRFKNTRYQFLSSSQQ
jgi:hypothetical protein